MSLVAVVLAAGKGTRMGSDLPKVLHPLLGEPLVVHTIRAARAAGATRVVVVVGHGAAQVQATLADRFPGVEYAVQEQQRGTGHAVLCALPVLADHDGDVLILSGDVPRLRAQTLERLARACADSPARLALATFHTREPQGYGRIIREGIGGEHAADAADMPIMPIIPIIPIMPIMPIMAIVEERDASPAQRAIQECNAGVYCVGVALLRRALPELGTANAQGEIYLTDLVARVAGQGTALEVPEAEVAGVNTPAQLAALEALALAESRAGRG
ncbi:MAG: NTP transferase domain-containing protein [Nannocystis sp.]|nr:NTP transferase domain-containing protein [Nannocystis sp.]MBA3550084.1 NTP transferase domain-containing protein [Nannocystis sp.]